MTAESNPPPAPVRTYEPDRFWNERLNKDFSLAGVGHASVGLQFNRWAYRLRRAVLLRALRRVGIGIAGKAILELGFGTGFYLDLWRSLAAAQVTAFDITDVAVTAARARFPANWRFERADIGQPLPVAPASFDLVTALDVLFHLVEDSAWNGALDNLAGALKPGGFALIFDKCQSQESARGHVRRRTLDAYVEALKARGLEVVHVSPLFVFMNSPTDLQGLGKVFYKTCWSLTKLPYKLGRKIGLGEPLGWLTGVSLYVPELLATRLLKLGPSTKILIARKGLGARG
jgi:SAM-dependent methyltransferase